MKSLLPLQIAKLEKLEAVIRRGLQTFVEVGDSLRVIRDEKLYLRDFDSFEAYCDTTWGWSKRRGNQLIQAAELVGNLPPTLAAAVTTEYDARGLLALEPAEQKQAIREAKKDGITVAESAKSFQEKPAAIDRKPGTIVPKPKSEPAPELDKTGWSIPPDLLPLWSRRGEMLAVANSMSGVKCAIEKAVADEDPLWRVVNNGTVLEAVKLYNTLKLSVPYAVCAKCQGKTTRNCDACKGTGLVSEFFWKQCVPKEDKAMRAKILATHG